MYILKEYDEKNRIFTLKMNRPQQLNTLTPEMVQEFYDALDNADADKTVSAVIITGEGKAFCAGSDLNARLKNAAAQPVQQDDPYLIQVRGMIGKIERLKKPVIAAVNGHAVGGGLEIALACDIRIASKTAKLGLTEAKVGAIAGGGGTQRLPRLIGAGLALEMLFTGEPGSGERAEQIGLVNYAVDAQDVLQAATDLASRIARNAPLSLNAYKQLVHKGCEMDIEQALDLEMSYANIIARSEDRAEGMKAFWKNAGLNLKDNNNGGYDNEITE